MAEKKKNSKLGVWAFIIGLVLAIIFALISGTSVPDWAIIVLAVIGIIVGLMNVTAKESEKFLIAAGAFMIGFQALSAVFSALLGGWTAVGIFFRLLNVFIAPAAGIVAVKVLFSIAKN